MSINYEETANKIKLLAHPERLRILDAIRRESECVCHLIALLNKPQPYVSQQLSLLRKAGIIEDEKDGLNVYYRLADREIAIWLDDILGEVVDEQPEMSQHKKLVTCPCPKCETEAEVMVEPMFAQ